MTGHVGHALLIPAADFVAPSEQTYDIKGISPHTHSVTLTAAQLTTLGAGGAVTVTSTLGAGHTHDVTIGCA
jgi:hypothetical protein